MTRSFTSLALTAAVALLLASEALAGGFGIDLQTNETVQPDDRGVVQLTARIRFEGCIPYAQLATERHLPGPAVGLEQERDGEWETVEAPWITHTCEEEACACRQQCHCGASCKGPQQPAQCACGDQTRPEYLRLEQGYAVEFERQARLAPGVYRLTVAATHPTLMNGEAVRFTSRPFTVEAGGEALQ